jgi:hypothetical protein
VLVAVLVVEYLLALDTHLHVPTSFARVERSYTAAVETFCDTVRCMCRGSLVWFPAEEAIVLFIEEAGYVSYSMKVTFGVVNWKSNFELFSSSSNY